MISVMRLPHERAGNQNLVSGFSASLDHSIHFHRKFNVDEWMYVLYETNVAEVQEDCARATYYDTQGNILATCIQEGLMSVWWCIVATLKMCALLRYLYLSLSFFLLLGKRVRKYTVFQIVWCVDKIVNYYNALAILIYSRYTKNYHMMQYAYIVSKRSYLFFLNLSCTCLSSIYML